MRFSLLAITLAPSLALASAPKLDDGIEYLHFTPYSVLPTEEDTSRGKALIGPDVDVFIDEGDQITSTRNYNMEVGFRGRFISVPKTILDIWFFNEQDQGWAWTEPRPRIRGYALGMEFVVKGDTANGIFYVDYLDSSMQEGYWDDVEEPSDHLDGDYLRPSENLGMVAFGANYAYEAHLIRTSQTDNVFGLSFLIGGGLGMGILAGKVDRWGPDEAGRPAYDRQAISPPDEDKRIPRIYPMVDINGGFRFNFGDRGVFRVEGGLHTLVYYGASMGLMF